MGKKGKLLMAFCLAIAMMAGCSPGEAIGDAIESVVGGTRCLLSMEPKEVQELRKQEIVQEEEGSYEYYFQQLTEEEKRLYRQILNGIRNYETSFYLSSGEPEEIDRAYHAFLRDHPELFWVHNRELVYKTTYSTYSVFEPGYGYTQEEIQAGLQSCEEAWQQVSALLSPEAGDYERVRTVYTWVIQHTQYASSPADQNIEGVFGDGQAVCAGYAGAIQYLLNRMGIPCIYVTGQSGSAVTGDGSHAWNVVSIGGNWYYVDATNGDQPDFFSQSSVGAEEVLYDYLCPFPGEYETISQADGEFQVPECFAVDLNVYIRNGGCFSYYQFEDVYTYAAAKLQNGDAILPLKFADSGEFRIAVEDLIENGRIQEIAAYYIHLWGLSETLYHYGLLEELGTIYIMF